MSVSSASSTSKQPATGHAAATALWVRTKTIAGVVGFWYPILSTVSRLRTWEQLADFVRSISAELHGIVTWFGLVIHGLLWPWHWIRDLVFALLPWSIPELWRDPVLIGCMVLAVPLRVFGMMVGIAGCRSGADRLNRLSQLVDAPVPVEEARAEHSRALERAYYEFVDRSGMLGWATPLLMHGPFVDYVRRLTTRIPAEWLDAEAGKAREQIRDLVEQTRDFQADLATMFKSRLARYAWRGAAVCTLVLAFSAEQLYLSSLGTAFAVIWRSMLAIVASSLGMLVVGVGAILVVSFGLPRLIGAVTKLIPAARRERIRDILLARWKGLAWRQARSTTPATNASAGASPATLPPDRALGLDLDSSGRARLPFPTLVPFAGIAEVGFWPEANTVVLKRFDGSAVRLAVKVAPESQTAILDATTVVVTLVVDGSTVDSLECPFVVQ